MATFVTLPALGESVTEGTVTRWLKQVGDEVSADEPLLEISTDKVDTEIPSPAAGTLLEIKVAEDETVEVGTELAIIGMPDETAATRGDGDAREPAAEQPAAEEPLLETPSPAGRAEEGAGEQAAEQPAAGTSVILPALGESVTEGTVTRWLKQVGDEVSADEPLLEISTDKVDTEIPAPASGVVSQILVPEDETAEVGTELAVIATDGEAAPAAEPSAPAEQPAPAAQAAPEPAPAAQAAPEPAPTAQ